MSLERVPQETVAQGTVRPARPLPNAAEQEPAMPDKQHPEWSALAAGIAPMPGDHLVTLRCGYLHHGIYVGDGKVVHYAGYCGSPHQGAVEEVALARFTDGQQLWREPCPAPEYSCHEVVRRARSRLDEHRYRLLSNNCEHFCSWCLSGESRSRQIIAWRTHPRLALRTAVRLVKAFHRCSVSAAGQANAGMPSVRQACQSFVLAGMPLHS